MVPQFNSLHSEGLVSGFLDAVYPLTGFVPVYPLICTTFLAQEWTVWSTL